MNRLLLVSIITLGAATWGWGQVSVNVQIGPGPYYGFPRHDVVYVERYVPVYDVPRVGYVSRYDGVAPVVIVNHYRQGWGWDRIHNRYRVPRHAFYGPPGHRGGFYGPGYGKRFGPGKGRHQKRDRWRR
jgi:hypothetical protein